MLFSWSWLAGERRSEGGTRRSSPSGLRKYSGKYALSSLLFCGECGTAYRRCTWTQHGEKRPVWRCVSRLSYGKKYCLHSPTLDEEPLQQAILGAINASMDNRTVLESRITAALWNRSLLPVAGETMSLADVERALEDLGRQFDSLLKEGRFSRASRGIYRALPCGIHLHGRIEEPERAPQSNLSGK